MQSMPTEPELRDAAKRLGHANDDGSYPPSLRKKLAAFVVEERDELKKEAAAAPRPPAAGSTADQLLAFHDELTDSRVPAEDARALTLAVAPALVRREGLHTKKENPHT